MLLFIIPLWANELIVVTEESDIREFPTGRIKISEVFPRAQTDVPEWFELVNVSATPIALRNWRYGNSDNSSVITQDEVTIQPNAYCVLTRDRKPFSLKYSFVSNVCEPDVWLPLNNSNDTLRLWNSGGVQEDIIAYRSSWFDRWTDQSIERVSLERAGVSREAWVVANRPSPGQPNGSVVFRAAEKPTIEIGPVRFSPDGDNQDDLLSIKLTLPALFTVSVSIYGFNGKKYIDLPITPQPCYAWNGKTTNGSPAPIGPFFVVATFKNGSQTTIVRNKGILWR